MCTACSCKLNFCPSTFQLILLETCLFHNHGSSVNFSLRLTGFYWYSGHFRVMTSFSLYFQFSNKHSHASSPADLHIFPSACCLCGFSLNELTNLMVFSPHVFVAVLLFGSLFSLFMCSCIHQI